MSVLILLQGPEQVASSRTRGFAYLPLLARAGVEHRVLVWNSERYINRTLKGPVPVHEHLMNMARHAGVVVSLLWLSRRYRTIYDQKVVLPRWVFNAVKRGGRRLVFDYDDAMYATAPEQHLGIRGRVRSLRARRFINALRSADVVTLENEPNREVTLPHCRRVLTVTGPIDTERYRPYSRSDRGPVVLGWIGSPSTTRYLSMLGPALRALRERGRDVVLHLIGAGPFDSPDVEVRRTPWTLEGEVAALATFDVGLMPLEDDPWSRGKGGYKILQYMAMGIPSVASPVGINTELLHDGTTGLLARTPDDWSAALDRLVTGREERRRMGAAAREDVVARFSLERYAPIIIKMLSEGDASR